MIYNSIISKRIHSKPLLEPLRTSVSMFGKKNADCINSWRLGHPLSYCSPGKIIFSTQFSLKLFTHFVDYK